MSRKTLSFVLAVLMALSLLSPVVGDGVLTAKAADTATADLRMGVLSDVHIGFQYDAAASNRSFSDQTSRWRSALMFYKEQGVDAIVVAGDLTDKSYKSGSGGEQLSNSYASTDDNYVPTQEQLAELSAYMEEFIDVWFEVFPVETGVIPIFAYGNHDRNLIAAQYWPERLTEAYPEIYGEGYQNVYTAAVNGYQFVFVHNARENKVTTEVSDAVEATPDKPVFYIQHCPLQDTTPGSATGAYGSGYGKQGRANVADYHNIVAFAGHTHAPLTDERSIWQGDAGNEGQFTAINTATINYASLNNDGMTVDYSTYKANYMQHGMYVTVSGSKVNVDRYSFYDVLQGSVADGWSANIENVDMIGESWSFDACDITDRPYAYDSRYENANAPVFPEGSALTVDAVTDTSVTVSIPAADLTAPEGFSDMIESYVLEACNPTSGEVEGIGRVATAYHIDSDTSRYKQTHTVKVSGLEPGTAYTLKVYAQEFFDKRSEPLAVDITTTGDLTTYRRGDVNADGAINDLDLTLLQAICAGEGESTPLADVDENGVLEYRDITELQAILQGKAITYPESGDLMDLVVKTVLSDANDAIEGSVIQNSVVRGQSNQAVKTWTVAYSGYPTTTMYFSEPVDLSEYTHLSFDTLFENEYEVDESYRKRHLGMYLISGYQEQRASVGSMNFDKNEEGWTTTTISLIELENIDLSAVTAIMFQHNFDEYDGRFDGVTEHAIYFDNFYGVTQIGEDEDLLATSTVTGGENRYGAGYTNGSNHAVKSVSDTVDVCLASGAVFRDGVAVTLDSMMTDGTAYTVQLLDEAGQAMGKAVTVKACNIYQSWKLMADVFGVETGTTASGLRFTVTEGTLYLDNLSIFDPALVEETVAEDWISMSTDGTKNLTYSLVPEMLKAEGSRYSMKLEVGTSDGYVTFNPESAAIYGLIDGNPDMTEGILGAYFYFGSQTPSVQVKLSNKTEGVSGWQSVSAAMSFVDLGDGWYFGYMDTAELADEFSAKNCTGNNIVRFSLTFPANYTVYMDGLMFPTQLPENPEPDPTEPESTEPESTEPESTEPESTEPEATEPATEAVSEDWINMKMDATSNLTYSLVPEMLKAEGSRYSMKLEVGTSDGFVQFNAESAAINGLIDGNPNMTEGILGAYFYFGSQTPSVQVRLSNKTENVSGWQNVSAAMSFVDLGDGWYFGYVDTAELADEFSALGCTGDNIVRFRLTFPKNYTVYMDGLMFPTQLPENPEPEPTEPEDPGDMLGATDVILSGDHGHWDNYSGSATGLTAQADTETVYGLASTRSWSFKATEAANNSGAVAQFAVVTAYDMTGKLLVFDVKFDSTDTAQTMALKTRLHESVTGSDVTSNISKTLKAGYWQTVALDFSGNVVSGKDLTQVQFITFTMDFASNTGTERALYIDNVRLVAAETVEEDLIQCKVDSGSTGNLYWLSDEYTYGDDSSLSMRVENKTTGDNDIYYSPQAQYGDDNLPNYKNKIFSAYFYFGDQTPYATLELVDKNWSGTHASKFRFEDVGDGWYLGQVNTASITTKAATTDLSQCIRFAINIASGAVVYVDDLKVLPGETVDDDWINMGLDTGATKGEFGSNTVYTYGEDSLVSMRYEPTGGSYIVFNPESEVTRNGGAWDAYPDMSEGIFSAYIYFGDQTPSVKLKLTSKTSAGSWKSSTDTPMNLEDVGGGWYHATLDLSSLTVPEEYVATQIIRIYMTFTAGQTVYIDNMGLLPTDSVTE